MSNIDFKGYADRVEVFRKNGFNAAKTARELGESERTTLDRMHKAKEWGLWFESERPRNKTLSEALYGVGTGPDTEHYVCMDTEWVGSDGQAAMHPHSKQPPICGAYAITNKESGRVYVGVSVDIERRWKSHVHALNKGSHTNRYLQSSWDKYKSNSFSFEVIERVAPDSDLLRKVEKKHLDKLSSNTYNKEPNKTEEVTATLPAGGDFSFLDSLPKSVKSVTLTINF